MRGYFARIWVGLASLIGGLRITLTHMLRKPVTLEYPHETPTLSPAYRGAIKLIRFEETNSHDCVACLQCERICPSFCIEVKGGKVEGIKKKRADVFTMDLALCSLCGLCIDACPTDTLEYSNSYDVAGYTRDFTHDLLKDFTDFETQFRDEQREREEEEARKKEEEKKKKAAAKAAAKAEAEAEAASEEAPSP